MDMPGYLDYGKIMQMNPFAAYQANQHMDLAKQFQDQKYQQEQNTTNKGTLENIFSAQDNPNRVESRILQNEGQGLLNEGQGYKNRTDKLGAERAEAMHQNNLNADQRAAALKMSDDDMKKFDYHVGELLRHPDPTQRAEGAKLQTYLSSYQAERRKAADAMALQQEQTRSHLGGINAQQEGQKNLEQMRIDAGKYKKGDPQGTTSSIYNSLYSGKIKLNEMPAVFTFAANGESDPASKQFLLNEAAKAEALIKQKPLAGKTGEIDAAAMTEMPARTQSNIYGNPQSTPQMTPQDAAALDWAKANPNDPRSAKILQKLGR